MYRLGLFLKRYRRVWYGILTVFLALLLTAVCSAHGTETQLSAQVVGQEDVGPCCDRAELLKNPPATEGEAFLVPRAVE